MLKGKFGKSTTPAGAFAALAICIAFISSPVWAQPSTFVIQHVLAPTATGDYRESEKVKYYPQIKIWRAETCDKPVQFRSDKQTITCTLVHTKCELCPLKDPKDCERDPKYCSFLVQSTQRAPVPIIIGQTKKNPDCVYATYWDYTLGQTITISGPCF